MTNSTLRLVVLTGMIFAGWMPAATSTRQATERTAVEAAASAPVEEATLVPVLGLVGVLSLGIFTLVKMRAPE